MDDPTVGELDRRLEAMSKQMRDGFAQLRGAIESLNYIHRDRYEAEARAVERRIDLIEDRLQWVSRALAGAVISIITAAVLTLMSVRGGL